MGFQATFNDRVIPAANRAFGETVTLKHGAAETDSFTATWEDVDNQLMDAEGFLTKITTRNFSFAVADAAINAVAFEPRAGDRVCMTENGVAKEFEMLPVGQEPAFELMPGGYRWLVRTKQAR